MVEVEGHGGSKREMDGLQYNNAECGGATSEVGGKMGGCVHHERICGGVGSSGRLWIRRMGEYGQLHTPD